MDYKQKYIKYKQKYLNLKNQYGSAIVVNEPRDDKSNVIRINGLPKRTTVENLERYLSLTNIPLFTSSKQPIYKLPKDNKSNNKSDFLINFENNDEANKNKDKIEKILQNFIPYVLPWNKKSKKLYIALPIAENSDIGKEIEHRTNILSKPSLYGTPTAMNINTPHLTLLEIYIPDNSKLDIFLSNYNNLSEFTEQIKNIFVGMFNINDLSKPLQLFSEQGNYEQLGRFITRVFNNKDLQSINKNNYLPFISIVQYILLTKIYDFTIPLEKINTIVEIEENLKAYYYPTNITTQTFTHFSLKPNKYPNSEMAISSYYKNWDKPHISVLEAPVEIDKVFDSIEEFKNASSGSSMSYLNLWRVIDKKKIKINDKIEKKIGSLSHIFCSYSSSENNFCNIEL